MFQTNSDTRKQFLKSEIISLETKTNFLEIKNVLPYPKYRKIALVFKYSNLKLKKLKKRNRLSLKTKLSIHHIKPKKGE